MVVVVGDVMQAAGKCGLILWANEGASFGGCPSSRVTLNTYYDCLGYSKQSSCTRFQVSCYVTVLGDKPGGILVWWVNSTGESNVQQV